MRRPIVWLLGGALFLVPPVAQADEWDSRDVEAAEHYRETERARAGRFSGPCARWANRAQALSCGPNRPRGPG